MVRGAWTFLWSSSIRILRSLRGPRYPPGRSLRALPGPPPAPPRPGEALAGPGVHPGLAVLGGFAAGDLLRADRAGHCPPGPAGRVVQGPLGDVEVEGADDREAVAALMRSVPAWAAPPKPSLTWSRCFHARAASSGFELAEDSPALTTAGGSRCPRG